MIYKQKLRGKNKKEIPLKIDIFKGNAIEVSTQSRYTTVIILCTQKKISAYKSSGAKIGICTLFQKLDHVFALFARNLLGIQNKSTTFANKGNKEQKQKNNGKERS